ncbi:hypothetical protein PYW08_011097 [Mythimna loreyi]|uniref:Uncharacterized protein n=1 Tax=Mythimna loreyi TaxID=667449 RepID=A0ACC2Q7E8_9NEOP|nr:hypothetical protein PYW08_011097 [Mythimna loreyi]
MRDSSSCQQTERIKQGRRHLEPWVNVKVLHQGLGTKAIKELGWFLVSKSLTLTREISFDDFCLPQKTCTRDRIFQFIFFITRPKTRLPLLNVYCDNNNNNITINNTALRQSYDSRNTVAIFSNIKSDSFWT